MITITTDDVAGILPRELTDEERARMANLIEKSVMLIEMEFARRGRDLEAELAANPWLGSAVKHAVSIMVGQAIAVGDNVGRASVSSTTGPQSDSITWSQGTPILWGGVGITDEILRLLGLVLAGMPLGRGGRVVPFGERESLRGAEFSERRWL